jgi:hypothetical protein
MYRKKSVYEKTNRTVTGSQRVTLIKSRSQHVINGAAELARRCALLAHRHARERPREDVVDGGLEPAIRKVIIPYDVLRGELGT